MTLVGICLPEASATPLGSSDPQGSAQGQATDLLNKINSLTSQESALSGRFDTAMQQLQAANGRVTQDSRQVTAAAAKAKAAHQALISDAVTAYEGTNNDSGRAGPAGSSLQAANNALVRNEYQSTLAGSEAADLGRYQLVSSQAATAQRSLQQSRGAVQSELSVVKQDKAQLDSLAGQVENEYEQLKGQEAVLMVQNQQAEAATVQRAAQQAVQQAQAEKQAAQAAFSDQAGAAQG